MPSFLGMISWVSTSSPTHPMVAQFFWGIYALFVVQTIATKLQPSHCKVLPMNVHDFGGPHTA